MEMSTELNNWQQTNQAYLSAALNWLRLRLDRISQTSPGTAASFAGSGAAHGSESKWRVWNKPERVATPRALLPPAHHGSIITDEQLAQAFKEMEAAEQAVHPPAMIAISRSFGLSRFEKE